MVKTRRLDADQSIAFDMGAGGRDEVTFFTDNPGGRFRTLTVTVPDGEMALSCSLVRTSGAYRRIIDGKWYLDSGRARTFAVDNIPQEAGTCRFRLSADSGPAARVVVSLTEHASPVPRVAMGEKLGALRLKNVPYGLARIVTRTPFGTISTEHPEFPDGSGFEQGDVTPEGDAYFLLPAGLWTVAVMPQDKQKATTLNAHYIPVHSGRETVLDWPLAMTSVFGRDGGSGLAINAIEPRGGEVAVTFALHGPTAAAIVPTPAALSIREGGVAADVLSVERTRIPMDIVLLVDSSGSMRGQMKNALAATRTFIRTLPDDAAVQVVDFDTRPRVLAGTTRPAVLAALSGIRADGATCLYDAVLKGLDMLADARRPSLLVFTDGFDANYNDTGPGSQATGEQVLSAAGKAGIPVFTIGFGKGHDRQTLDRLAHVSGGRYYPAGDPKALEKAFAVVGASLDNTFSARYARPGRGRPSDLPVVTCMVDTSGSMNTTPDKSGCDYRIDKVRTVLHDFIAALPDAVLGQVMSFNDDVMIDQVTTDNKATLLAAVNTLHAGGGTDITGAVQAALETQAAIPLHPTLPPVCHGCGPGRGSGQGGSV